MPYADMIGQTSRDLLPIQPQTHGGLERLFGEHDEQHTVERPAVDPDAEPEPRRHRGRHRAGGGSPSPQAGWRERLGRWLPWA